LVQRTEKVKDIEGMMIKENFTKLVRRNMELEGFYINNEG
jgi:hypothetical protein